MAAGVYNIKQVEKAMAKVLGLGMLKFQERGDVWVVIVGVSVAKHKF